MAIARPIREGPYQRDRYQIMPGAKPASNTPSRKRIA